MDGHRFDDLTRALAGRPSRRGVLRALAGGAAVAVGGRATAARAGQAKRPLCHATGDPARPYEVIDVAEPAWEAHLAHGDAPYLDCCPGDACPGPHDACGGGGVPGACGCTPKTLCEPGDTGPVDDGCGGELTCGCALTEADCPAGVDAAACACRVDECGPGASCPQGCYCIATTAGNRCHGGATIDCDQPCASSADCTDPIYPVCALRTFLPPFEAGVCGGGVSGGCTRLAVCLH